MVLLITENQLKKMNEDINPLIKRWHHERFILKDYLIKYGKTMVSKENGKEYKVLYDTFISNLLGINFGICVQWNSMTNMPGDIIYVRAYDKFTLK